MNKQEKKVYMKQYQKTHIIDLKEYKKKYRHTHKAEIKQYRIIYYKNHIIQIKQWQKDHKKEYQEANNKYYKTHKKEKLLYMKKYLQNPINKIIHNIRIRTIKALKRNTKKGHTIELIGCSIKYLKYYLQLKFTKGMNWENYGYKGWHVDHIRPCSSFDLSKKVEQYKCFNYKNLQPLWYLDNLIKGTK
jgi:hypothetical protein